MTTTTIELEYPVQHETTTYTELTMRRPKVRDQINADKQASSRQDVEISLFANLCEVPGGVIEDLDMVDYLTLQEVYKGFLSSRRKVSVPTA